MTDDPIILLDVADRVATVTMNRPGSRNALNAELRRAIPRTIGEADARDEVDVIILTGADPAFCAGLDLKELGAGEGSLEDSGAAGNAQADRHGPFPVCTKPVIGAINGAAITGGFELALNCDFLIASERARFADTHARVGIQPGWGLTVLLPQAVGVRRAREMSATGNFLDADTALTWGLVNHVVPHDELLPFARQLAADIASNDQAGVQQIYATYDQSSEGTVAEGWEVENRMAGEWLRKAGFDAAEIEKRRQGIVDRGRQQV